MKDKKFFSEEILSDKELKEVAGGNNAETMIDGVYLHVLGFLTKSKRGNLNWCANFYTKWGMSAIKTELKKKIFIQTKKVTKCRSKIFGKISKQKTEQKLFSKIKKIL